MKHIINLDFSNVPYNWAVCFNNNCPLAEDCLRHHVAQILPNNTERTTCITPLALQDGKCQWFASCEPVTTAWGLNRLYDKVYHKDYAPLKKRIATALRGRSNYYRYNNGELTLTPEEQQQIANIMAEMGYNEPPVFEHYRKELQFDYIPQQSTEINNKC